MGYRPDEQRVEPLFPPDALPRWWRLSKAPEWAAAFCEEARERGYRDGDGKPLDEEWVRGWFADALDCGYDHRLWEPSDC